MLPASYRANALPCAPGLCKFPYGGTAPTQPKHPLFISPHLHTRAEQSVPSHWDVTSHQGPLQLFPHILLFNLAFILEVFILAIIRKLDEVN